MRSGIAVIMAILGVVLVLGGGTTLWASALVQFTPRDSMWSSNWGAIGNGLPMAIGAQLAVGDKRLTELLMAFRHEVDAEPIDGLVDITLATSIVKNARRKPLRIVMIVAVFALTFTVMALAGLL